MKSEKNPRERQNVFNLPPELLASIRTIGQKHGLAQILLFGSRARGDHSPRSDVDLALRAENAEQYFTILEDLDQLETLLRFDVVDMNSLSLSRDLKEEILRDGKVIYEKI